MASAIVRNTCYTWFGEDRPVEAMTEFDEELHRSPRTARSWQLAGDDRERLNASIGYAATEVSRSAGVRELEGCSYKEIASITSIPIGTGDVRTGARAAAAATNAHECSSPGGPP